VSGFDAVLGRIGPDGAPDPSFDDGSTSTKGLIAIDYNQRDEAVSSVALQPDGKILAAGASAAPGSGWADGNFLLVRVLASGERDLTFNGTGIVVSALAGDDGFQAVVVLPNGEILCGGFVESSPGNRDMLLALFREDGTPDEAIGPGGMRAFHVGSGRDDRIVSMRLDARGRLVVLAASANERGDNDFAVLRFH
jgi:uncharacterized delta-60 repeat protein